MKECNLVKVVKTSTQEILSSLLIVRGFPGGPVGKKPPAGAGDVRSIPGSGRSPGGGDGNPLQCSCLGNPVDRGPGLYSPWGLKESDMTE